MFEAKENALLQVVTVAEANELWDKDPSNIRRDLIDAAKYNNSEKYTKQEYRKSGSTWLISVNALTRLYGPPKRPVKFRRG